MGKKKMFSCMVNWYPPFILSIERERKERRAFVKFKESGSYIISVFGMILNTPSPVSFYTGTFSGSNLNNPKRNSDLQPA